MRFQRLAKRRLKIASAKAFGKVIKRIYLEFPTENCVSWVDVYDLASKFDFCDNFDEKQTKGINFGKETKTAVPITTEVIPLQVVLEVATTAARLERPCAPVLKPGSES